MDKRWIYIIIIFIIGIACLYFIVDSSTTVGRANINLNKFTLTMPSDYNIEDNTDKYIEIVNKNTNERIEIKDLGKKKNISSERQKKIESLQTNENITLIKNTTIAPNNSSLLSIYYERLPDTINRVTYFTKFNETFSIECYDFHDNSTIEKNTMFLMENIRLDYKQKQS